MKIKPITYKKKSFENIEKTEYFKKSSPEKQARLIRKRD